MRLRQIALPLFLALACSFSSARGQTQELTGFNGDYELAVRVADDGVAVSGRWTRPASSSDSNALEFLLSPLVGRPRIGVRCGGEQMSVRDIRSVEEGADLRWTVELEQPCRARQPIAIEFDYVIRGAGAPQLRTSANQGFAGGFGEVWYPQIRYSWRETGRLTMSSPRGIRVIATGSARGSWDHPSRHLRSYEVATPAKFAFAYGRYRVSNIEGDPPVRVLTLSSGVDNGAIRNQLARAIGPLRNAFGAPPVDQLAVVEVDFRSQVLGTSEFGMLFVDRSEMAAEAGDLGYWAHELGHQWWGVSVRAEARSPGATMLTEGLAQYGALIALEASLGGEAAGVYRRENGRHSIAHYARVVEHTPDVVVLATAQPSSQEEVIQVHMIATSKGALALDLFARTFGRDRFHALLRSFLRERSGRAATWEELELRLRGEFGADAQSFLEQWLHRPGVPRLDVAWHPTRNGARIVVAQQGRLYSIRVPIELLTRDGVAVRSLSIAERDTTFDIAAGAPVEAVVVDPDAQIPMMATTARLPLEP